MSVSGRAGLRRGSDDLVGRDDALDVLRRAVDNAVEHKGSLILITGEPGIGKTRLLEEVTRRGGELGAIVRRAACWEGDGAPAFWPWIQIIRAHAADRTSEDLVVEIGPYAQDVVRLVPELGDELGARPEPGSERIGEQPRFRLFDAIASFLRRAAAVKPLVIVVDDLHWADVGSVMLMRFCNRELRDAPVLMVGALRDLEVDAASDLGSALATLQQGARTLELGGLGRGEVQDLLAAAIGHHQAERLAADVHRRSGGNPLFVRELGRLLTPGARPGLGSAPSVPASIRAVLERRFSRLSSHVVDLLCTAAVAAEEFRTDVLQAATGQPRDHVLELLDEAVRARLVHHADDTLTRFAFTHALVRDVLYNRLTLGERARVHTSIGAAIERIAVADPPLAELAHHFQRAALPEGDTRAVDYAEAAGRQSLVRLAFEDAAAHFERAIDALGSATQDDDRRARLLLALGEARMRTGDLAGAREAFDRVAALARTHRKPELLAEAAVGFGAALGGLEIRMFDRAQIDLLEEALEATGTADSSLRALAMALLSIAVTYTESSERRLDLAREATDMARRVGDPASLVQALGAHCDAIAAPDHSEQRLALANEMIRVAQEAQDHCGELLGRRHRVVALLELADIAAVDAEIDAYAATAETVRQPLYDWYVPMWRGMRALMQGRTAESRALNDEVGNIGARAHSDNAALLSEVLRWNRLRDEGRFEECADVLRAQLGLTAGVPAESFWLGLCLPATFPEEAKAALGRLAPDDFAEFPLDAIWLAAMSGIADACDVVRDAAVAQKAYRMLLPYAGRFALDGTATACYGSVSRFLGVLASVLRRSDDAAQHFEDALRANRRAGASMLVAHTRCGYAAMLLEAGEDERAQQLVDEAIAAYEELDMHVRVEWARGLLGRAEAPPAVDVNVFRREGDFWTLTYGGRTARVKDTKGLRDVAALIGRQGREVHVADLIAASAGRAVSGRIDDGAVIASSTDPILDEEARAQYRSRLEGLQDELEEAEQFSDPARATRARAEMDVVAGELAAALGLGGRARTMTNAAERARKAVAQRVRNTLRRMETEHLALARHLDRSLRMGSFCSYSPERFEEWTL